MDDVIINSETICTKIYELFLLINLNIVNQLNKGVYKPSHIAVSV